MSKFYITTPIYYINDRPHIGHAYSTIAADTLARYFRGQGVEVLFSTGTDENSQKTVIAAAKRKQELKAYIDELAGLWQSTWDKLDISYDTFIRTTEPGHQAAVKDFVGRVQTKGDIYLGKYRGLYCVGCEEFKKEDELVNGKCPEHNTEPELVEEENYFFALSKYQQALLDHIEAHPDFVQPESRRNEVVAFIKRGLEDFSISRSSREWGIPWPGDPGHVVYVWFDALINYLTVAGYPGDHSKWWPADVHLVGKNIIKFHCIYWPAMLLSAGLPLPKMVFAHGFFTVDGTKISKSLGNAIDPLALAEKYGVDPLRYYLLREIPFGTDGEFTDERFVTLYNTDLANELGNLVQRVASMLTRYLGGTLPAVPPPSHDVAPYHEAMLNLKLDKALEHVWLEIKGLNQFLEEEKPWEKAKAEPEELKRVLGHAVGDLAQISDLLTPFLPETAEKITQTFAGGKVHPEVGILFPKHDEPHAG